ncbi:hypothetical protein GCM10010360_59000 [Streptomyces nogalater]
MTTTRFHGLLHRDTRKDSLSTDGLLTFSPTLHPPGATDFAPEGRNDHAPAAPQETGTLLHEFLALLEAVQEEFNERWSAQENADGHLDRV